MVTRQEVNEELRESARILGRRGGAARAKALTARQRVVIARQGAEAANSGRSTTERASIGRRAAQARWNGQRAEERIRENRRRMALVDALQTHAQLGKPRSGTR